MQPLQPPDTFYLSAAVGWLELGNPSEARAELDHVAPALHEHPGVLEVRWQIEAATRQWDRCREVAGALMRHAPESPTGWILQAYALRRVPGGGVQTAWNALFPAVGKFPKEPIIPYNLACYACQLGNQIEAWQWLNRAFAIGNRHELKAMALGDSDLQPLWAQLADAE